MQGDIGTNSSVLLVCNQIKTKMKDEEQVCPREQLPSIFFPLVFQDDPPCSGFKLATLAYAQQFTVIL